MTDIEKLNIALRGLKLSPHMQLCFDLTCIMEKFQLIQEKVDLAATVEMHVNSEKLSQDLDNHYNSIRDLIVEYLKKAGN